MRNRLGAIVGARFWPLFILPNAAFLFLAYITDAAWLISVLNIVVIALSVGVCSAYAPAIFGMLFGSESIERHDWLALGIFLAWFSVLELRVWSVIWRWMGMPVDLTSNGFISFGLLASAMAATFHLAAPGGVGGRVPTRRWIKIGLWIAAAVFVAIALMQTFSTADLG